MAKQAKKTWREKKRTSGERMNKRSEKRGKTDIQKEKMLNWRRNTLNLSQKEKRQQKRNLSRKSFFLK